MAAPRRVVELKRSLDAEEVKPRKVGYYLQRRDPDFPARMAEVVVRPKLQINVDNGRIERPAVDFDYRLIDIAFSGKKLAVGLRVRHHADHDEAGAVHLGQH